jgi:hypothetical protein
MTQRIRQIIAAEGWYAVFARSNGPTRDYGSSGGPRSGAMSGLQRSSGPVPEFLPLVAWALVGDDAGAQPERIVGVLVHDDLQPEIVDPDDPGFLGYAGPGDPAVDRTGLTPDWRALAKRAISELKGARSTTSANRSG